MTSQIGPVYDCYLVYNSQGRSKGVAIVHFQRRGDALEARRMFDGKIIDGRKPTSTKAFLQDLLLTFENRATVEDRVNRGSTPRCPY